MFYSVFLAQIVLLSIYGVLFNGCKQMEVTLEQPEVVYDNEEPLNSEEPNGEENQSSASGFFLQGATSFKIQIDGCCLYDVVCKK